MLQGMSQGRVKPGMGRFLTNSLGIVMQIAVNCPSSWGVTMRAVTNKSI